MDTYRTVSQGLQDVVDRLRADTRASRTTIRADFPALGLELEEVAAEARGEGVRTLIGQRTSGVRDGAAVRWLCENRRTFVMEDCLNPWAPEVAPEDYVIELYGIRSEMVSGVFRGNDLIGIVSVHYTAGERHWSEDEVAMIERAAGEVRGILDRLDSGPRRDEAENP